MKVIRQFQFLILSVCFVGFSGTLQAQASFSGKLAKSYSGYKEKTIDQRRFTREDLQPLIEEYQEKEAFQVKKLGESIEGRELDLISIGHGSTQVLLWSQMHGDESTATMAIFDILNFFESSDFKAEKQLMLDKLSIHFIPMLNPDGAEVFRRRNALGVDINRDAVRLQSSESRILKRVRDSLDADFGFNLHDQSRYYNAQRTPKPATISFLAPAYNYEKEVNESRGAAMKLIAHMNQVLQQFAPGQVGRYNDDFEPRAFGDNIQKWGTSTVLIESGGYPGDREKQEIRKLNFIAILSALNSISSESYKSETLAGYNQIPENDRMLFDLKLKGAHYKLNDEDYILDLGIDLNEVDKKEAQDFYYYGRVVDQGDLSTSYGYQDLDASAYTLVPAKIYPQTFADTSEVQNLDFSELLKNGYGYLKLEQLPQKSYTNLPLNLVSEDYQVSQNLHPGIGANFFLEKNGKPEYAVINGFLLDLKQGAEKIKNALIFR